MPGADEHPEAAAHPLSAKGQEAPGSGLTVYSSAEPWILAANGRAREPGSGEDRRAHHQMAASAASVPPGRFHDIRTAATLASM